MKQYIPFVIVALLVFKWDDIYWMINPPPDFSNAQNEVVMYATSWCSYCEKARDFLNRMNVAFHEFDIEQSPQARKEFERLGGGGVPLMLVNGKVISGYSTSKILEYLEGAE
ncbi:MAG: glutaredoxin family protein [Pseudomonadales bacterium]|nr:glutaredoxin family protein [Pseudomonadales bacterium]